MPSQPHVNTIETQPLCHDCKRAWNKCPQTTVYPFPIRDKVGLTVKEIVWLCEDCRNKRLAARTYYCYKHRKSHTQSECDGCVWCENLQRVGDGHFASPVPEDTYVDFRGWRFTAPFICMGCGVEVCIHQWCFSRSCGPCDLSTSTTRRVLYRQCFAGPHEKLPTWGKGRGDIDESHFLDPAKRLDYPVMRSPEFKLPQRITRRSRHA